MGKAVASIIGIVAAVAIAIAAPYLAPIALGALGITATATAIAIATAVIAVGLSLAVSFAFRALGVGAPSAKNAVGPPQVFRQSITNSFIIYGKRRVGGLLVFFHARQSGSDHFRYFVVAAAGHRCKQVDSWMLNDEVVTVDGSGKVTSGKYANAAWLWFQRGLASETANATFVSECGGNWTANHKGNAVAAIYAKFQLTDAVVQAGMPNITAVIEGRDEILDYRDGSVGYSRNAALIFYDWLRIAREEGGFGAYDDEVPLGSWIAAQANVCDETVNGSPRYAFDAVITTGAAPSEVRDSMVVNCAGTYTYSGGKHLMRPGHWVPVTVNLGEGDLAGPIQVTPFFPADSAANEVQGTYISPADGYQGMPFTTQSIAGDDVRQLDLDLAFITNKDQADRVARVMLKRAACEKQVVWPMNIAGIGVRALDVVQADTSRYGLSNYAWVVSTWGLSSDFGVVLNLREENAEIYDDPAPVSPSSPPAIVQPSGPLVTVSETQTALRATYQKGITAAAADAGSSVTITISGASAEIDYPGIAPVTPGTLPVSLTGLAYSSKYYLYADVDEVGDGSPHYGATTVYGDALNSSAHPLRMFLGIEVDTPAHAGSPTSGSGVAGGYGGSSTGGGPIP